MSSLPAAAAQALPDAVADQGQGPGYGATVAALAVGQILAWAVLYYAFSAVVLTMRQATGWSEPALMGAYTLGLTTWGIASYHVGAAIDAGRGRAVMVGGALLGGLCCVGWSQASAPWMLYPVFGLMGIAMAMTLYEPAFAVLTKRYPTRYRDAITSLTLVAGFASTICFPGVAALMHAGLDWRGTVLTLAGVLLFIVVPLHLWALRGPMLVAAPAEVDEQADATLHEALRHLAFWMLTACFLLYAFVQVAFWAHVMPAFAALGVPQQHALWVVMAVGPAQVLGRFVYAAIGRGWSLRLVGGVVMALLPLSMLLMAYGRSLPALLLFALLFGLANGLVTIVRGGLVPMYWGRAHVGRIGGLMSAIGLVARAAAPLFTAWLLLVLAGYQQVLLVFVALGVAAVLCFWWAGAPR